MDPNSEFRHTSFGGPDRDAAAPQPGWSTGKKVAVILGSCCAALMLACCGVFGYLGFQLRQSVTDDPAEVIAIRDQIVTAITLPAEYKPQVGMNLTLAGQGMRMAMFGETSDPNTGGAALMLMHMMVTANEAQMQEDLDNSLGRKTNVQVESSETKSVTIDGTMVNFVFAKAKTQESGKPLRQVTGVFPGKTGTVMLMLFVPEEKWDEEQVLGILESIKK
jgi:hypothetical protein